MKKMIDEIRESQEWLETTEGDEIRCISLEELEGILTRFLGVKVKI